MIFCTQTIWESCGTVDNWIYGPMFSVQCQGRNFSFLFEWQRCGWPTLTWNYFPVCPASCISCLNSLPAEIENKLTNILKLEHVAFFLSLLWWPNTELGNCFLIGSLWITHAICQLPNDYLFRFVWIKRIIIIKGLELMKKCLESGKAKGKRWRN